MLCTFCFSAKGKSPADAKEQANKTGKPVLFFEGIFRYVLFPNDDNIYEYTTKDEVFDLNKKKIRNDIIKQFRVDPDSLQPTDEVTK